jgi:8-oxo-dGTP pyrophosphatase MutT (NUDIX family)
MNNRTSCLLIRDGVPGGEVLLGLKKRGFGTGKYSGFGGKVEDGETIAAAAVRELEEEASIRVDERDLRPVGHMTFLFPNRPAWNQTVHVFLVREWRGDPLESGEMKPVWFRINELPFKEMWQDAFHWLPDALEGKKLRMRFVFADDNENVRSVHREAFLDGHAHGGRRTS